jgi:hypothetical protein
MNMKATKPKGAKTSKAAAEVAVGFGLPSVLEYTLTSGNKLKDATFAEIMEQIETNIINETAFTENDMEGLTFGTFAAQDDYSAQRLAILAFPDAMDEALVALKILKDMRIL